MAGFGSTTRAIVMGVVLAAGMVAGPFCSSTQAQMRMGMGMGAGMGGGKVAAGEVEQFGKILALDKAQLSAFKDLHQAYETEYDQAMKTMQDKMEKMRAEAQDTGDWSAMMKDGQESAEKFQTKSTDLEKSLMSDLKALLTPDQTTKWPVMERAHRRNQSLGGTAGIPGFGLAGESVDLVKMVEELKLKKTPEAVSQSLDRYESEMDSALIERDGKRKEMADQMNPFGKKDGKGGGGGDGVGMPDFKKICEMMTEMRKTGLKVRDLNDRYSTLVASGLPDDVREDFNSRFKKAKFPQVYRESYTTKSLSAAAGFKDLDPQQQTGVTDLAAIYKRESVAANDRYAKAQTDAEKDGGGEDMMGGWMKMMNGDQGGDDSELSQAKKAKRKLDTDTVDKLKAILTPQQVERLPERENNMFGGGRGR